MAGFAHLPPVAQHGSYVVAGPVRTDAIGDILRASFVPGKDMDNELSQILARLDQPMPRN